MQELYTCRQHLHSVPQLQTKACSKFKNSQGGKKLDGIRTECVSTGVLACGPLFPERDFPTCSSRSSASCHRRPWPLFRPSGQLSLPF